MDLNDLYKLAGIPRDDAPAIEPQPVEQPVAEQPMDGRDDMKAMIALVTPEQLNQLVGDTPVEEEGFANSGDEYAGEPEAYKGTLGSPADLSLRRYLGANGVPVNVDETKVYEDHKVEDITEAWNAYKLTERPSDRSRRGTRPPDAIGKTVQMPSIGEPIPQPKPTVAPMPQPGGGPEGPAKAGTRPPDAIGPKTAKPAPKAPVDNEILPQIGAEPTYTQATRPPDAIGPQTAKPAPKAPVAGTRPPDAIGPQTAKSASDDPMGGMGEPSGPGEPAGTRPPDAIGPTSAPKATAKKDAPAKPKAPKITSQMRADAMAYADRDGLPLDQLGTLVKGTVGGIPTTLEVDKFGTVIDMKTGDVIGGDDADAARSKSKGRSAGLGESDIDENAFNQAAAAAARAGKDSFEFGGKTHKTTMKKAVAHKLDDDINRLRSLAGMSGSVTESNGTFVGINTKTGDFESGISRDEAMSGKFTHMLPDDTTYFDPDTAEELVGAPDEEMKAMGWEKVKPKGTFACINVDTGEYGYCDKDELHKFTHMMPAGEFTYFDPDTAEELVGAPDEEMKAMGWEKVKPMGIESAVAEGATAESEELSVLRRNAGI